MPLLNLSSASSRLIPANEYATPPSSPTKTGHAQEPKSPPTPHKIKLLQLEDEKPAAGSLHKLKISLTPRKQQQKPQHQQQAEPVASSPVKSEVVSASSQPDSKGPKKK